MVNYEPTDGAPFQALSDPNLVKPTLDWATRQAYGLAKDGSDHLVWDGGHHATAMVPARRDVESEIDEVETVWANGLVAQAHQTDLLPAGGHCAGRFVEGPALVSELTLHGAPVGTAVWFEKDQVFAYSLPGLMTGVVVIGPEHLKANYGGWPFTPDTTWLNLQIIAAHHFKTLLAKQGTVARACEPPRPSRLAQFFMPTRQRERGGLRRLPLARRLDRSRLLRRSRPLLREGRLRLEHVVAVVEELDVRSL